MVFPLRHRSLCRFYFAQLLAEIVLKSKMDTIGGVNAVIENNFLVCDVRLPAASQEHRPRRLSTFIT
jgi:hypothetical protein